MIKPSFKAISKETNKWVCGNLTQDNRKDYIIEWIVTEEGGHRYIHRENVFPGTVCEGTFVTARNGDYAYEDDIIVFTEVGTEKYTTPHIGIINRSLSSFEVKDLNTARWFQLEEILNNFTIVGNLYDRLNLNCVMETFGRGNEAADKFRQFITDYNKWQEKDYVNQNKRGRLNG